MSTPTQSLQDAYSRFSLQGRYAFGTAAIIESLHKDYNYSYEKIASIAKVSIAGLRRWREFDKGEHTSFAPLQAHVETLLGEGANTAPLAAQAGEREAPPSDTRQIVPLTIAEAKLGLALKFDVDPAMIDIVIKG